MEAALVGAALLLAPVLAAAGTRDRPEGNREIRGMVGGSPLIIRTFDWLGGEIGSLQWRGKEFSDAFNRGPADNKAPMPEKRVAVGFRGLAHAIEHRARFTVPKARGEASVELLSGVIPRDFSKLWLYDPYGRQRFPALEPDGGMKMGEYSAPLILATPDGSHALGFYSPDLPQLEAPGGGYVVSRIAARDPPGASAVRWAALLRERTLAPGDHELRAFSVVGTLGDVMDTLNQLHDFFQPSGCLDAAGCGNISGWACIPSKAERGEKINVDIYADGPGIGAGGRMLGRVLADQPREGSLAGACGDSRVGFSFPTPDFLKDGRPHAIYAFGLSDVARNPLLGGAGKPVLCPAGAPAPATDAAGGGRPPRSHEPVPDLRCGPWREGRSRKPSFPAARRAGAAEPAPAALPKTVSKAEASYQRGLRLYLRGDLEAAAGQWRQAAELDPKDERARKALQRLRDETAGAGPRP